MELDQLKQILTLVREHGISELELEVEGWRLKLRTETAGVPPAAVRAMAEPVQAVAAPAQTPPAATGPAAFPASVPVAPAGDGGANLEVELAVVKSPIVGTFYRSAEPGGPFFVEVGARVKKGQVLCIIEAMKLMNEIDSEYDGEVVNVYVENGQPVQYGERLFAIRST
jgi:acetyl-CoA carboxylase biotin carboxyl carrier protein